MNPPRRLHGDNREYVVARLKRDRPDLAGRMAAGELSAHAAAVEAGFGRRKVSVSVTEPDSVARALRRHMTPADLQALRDLLNGELPVNDSAPEGGRRP